MTIKILTATFSVLVSSPGFAACPSNMEVDQLVECITVEGSGSNYQNWQKKNAKLAGNSSESYNASTKSEKVADAATTKDSQLN